MLMRASTARGAPSSSGQWRPQLRSVVSSSGPRCSCVSRAASTTTTTSSSTIKPAVLVGTPDQSFNLPPEELIKRAQELFAQDSGVKNPDLLSDTFRFEFPVVSLSKEQYLAAVGGFKLKDAFPDLDPHPYHWRVDVYEPNRVWFTTRTTATHTGPLKFGGSTYQPTGKVVYGAPECLSYTFDANGKCTSFTGGYIMDRRVGNTQGLGALFGILAAIGGPVLKPGSPVFIGLSLAAAARRALRSVFDVVTFGLFKEKPAAQ